MKNSRNILICPLEWGLGHAARMIPIATRMKEMGHNVIIGSGEEHLALYRREIPGIALIFFPGFKPTYSRYLPQYLAMLLRTPLLIYHIMKEHNMLKQLISRHNIDIVISDNRFGLWNKKIKTIYVTHLLLIPLPGTLFFLEYFGVLLHRLVIRKYDLCLVPDLPGDLNITGRLSHRSKLPSNTRFIGILSRFSGIPLNASANPVKSMHNTVILSGPEPQRGILGKKLQELLRSKEIPAIFLGGRPDMSPDEINDGKTVWYNHLRAPEMKALVTTSESIITRSGYTTIMELISLNCSALLIPTPGQTEQEYLADYLARKGWFTAVSQNKLNEGITLPGIRSVWTEEIVNQSRELLEKVLAEISEY